MVGNSAVDVFDRICKEINSLKSVKQPSAAPVVAPAKVREAIVAPSVAVPVEVAPAKAPEVVVAPSSVDLVGSSH